MLPRSNSKRAQDLLETIRNDPALRREFVNLFLEIMRTDFTLANELTDIISNKIAEEASGRW